MSRRVLLGLVLVIMLAACGGDEPEPETDPSILSGIDSLPKEIATIALTPTPSAVLDQAGLDLPTATPAPPRPTATLTPYVGIFLGEPTSESGEAVPNTIPTLAPYAVNSSVGLPASGSVVGSADGCSQPVAQSFAGAYNSGALQDRLGCPVSGGLAVQLVAQPFERGDMVWRDTLQIVVLADDGRLWQVADVWQEGSEDPSLSPPGGLVQPVRGFGLVWRSNQAIQDALGWGLQSESPYSSQWQDFERGAMFTGQDGLVYALYPAEGQHSGPLSP
jgi:hypothetical protein